MLPAWTGWPAPWRTARTQQASTAGAAVTCPTTRPASPRYRPAPPPGTLGYTPRATWTNAWTTAQASTTPARRRSLALLLGLPPAATSPEPLPATTLDCRQASNWTSPTGKRYLPPLRNTLAENPKASKSAKSLTGIPQARRSEIKEKARVQRKGTASSATLVERHKRHKRPIQR